jgi:hypothetical protein
VTGTGKSSVFRHGVLRTELPYVLAKSASGGESAHNALKSATEFERFLSSTRPRGFGAPVNVTGGKWPNPFLASTS